MTSAVANDVFVGERTRSSVDISPALAVSAFGSIGAGAIHAAAIGVHSELRQVVISFALLATLQIGWGVLALMRRSGRLLALAGVAVNAAAVGGWIIAKTSGIPFIDGFETAESPTFVDTSAMVLAAIAVVGGLLAAFVLTDPVSWFGPVAFTATAILTAVFTTFGMVQAGNHSHGAAGHTHDGTAADGHTHDAGTTGTSGGSGGGHSHGPAAVVPPKEYDPTKPIDLGGVPGVTAEQQARAENLIAITLARLPKYADYRVAERDGFRSIGDGFTGDEHFINVNYFDDNHILDPDYPESLVYKPDGNGGRVLAAAMFMMGSKARLTDVPDVGGKLTQWHIHNNLCFTGTGQVAGLVDANGNCANGLNHGTQAPMIHVWITKNPCGPFAALEGVGGGQIKPGETKLCDHAHGAA